MLAGVVPATYGAGVTTDGERIIGTPQAAELLGFNIRKVQRLLHTGQIPIVTRGVGGEYLLRESDVERYAVEHARKTP